MQPNSHLLVCSLCLFPLLLVRVSSSISALDPLEDLGAQQAPSLSTEVVVPFEAIDFAARQKRDCDNICVNSTCKLICSGRRRRRRTRSSYREQPTQSIPPANAVNAVDEEKVLLSPRERRSCSNKCYGSTCKLICNSVVHHHHYYASEGAGGGTSGGGTNIIL